ncbi:hypothetical protein CSUI_006188 [Cystoisospora suis]|uniref:Uncharacterized protein n=1 Tax=Cystoisospora suis TaxID=483139 RepID=A0A2C6KUZ3_9APIC|nr:hypothetical protein CSUI_006188 [Cystoisospora suis]
MHAATDQAASPPERRRDESPSAYLRHLKSVRYVIDKLRSNRARFLLAAAYRRQQQLGTFASRTDNRGGPANSGEGQSRKTGDDEDEYGFPPSEDAAQSDAGSEGVESALSGDEKNEAQADKPTTSSRRARRALPWKVSIRRSIATSAGDDMDVYLAELLVPLLHDGLVALCKAVELMLSDSSKKRFGREYHSRFSPLCWLAQYLLRHHPKHRPSLRRLDAATPNGENPEKPTQTGAQGACLQEKLNCRHSAFYELIKDIVDEERARRDFLLRKEEVKHVFEAYRLEKSRRLCEEERSRKAAARRATQGRKSERKNGHNGNGEVAAGGQSVTEKTSSDDSGVLLFNLGGDGSDSFENSSDDEGVDEVKCCSVMVEDIEELMERLDTFWELGGRMVEQFQENSPPLAATENADIIGYILPQQQTELVIEDADDVQIGEFWVFLKNYTEVQGWIRRELLNKRKQNVQVQLGSEVRQGLLEGLMRRKMIVAQRQDDDEDAERSEQQKAVTGHLRSSVIG